METNRFLREYTTASRAYFNCPKCGKGHIAFPSNVRNHSGGVFTQITACNACSAKFALAGDYREVGGVLHFYLKYVNPPFDFFEIPNGCPSPLREQIRRSFQLSWLNPDAAANVIRVVVELILDGANIRKLDKRSRRVTTHDRILEFHKINPDIGELLLAMKWLGNEGSHAVGHVSAETILSDFETLELALSLLYPGRISAMAQQINRDKGTKA